MPVSSCSAPIGRCTATQLVESCERSCSSVRKKSARSRSSMFTKTTRDEPELVGEAPGAGRSHLDAHDAADRDERSFHDPGGAAQLALEAGSPGTSTRLTLRSCQSCARATSRSRADACARPRRSRRRSCPPRPAEPVDRAGLEEQRLDERRLPGPAVADDGDVADLGGLGHGRVSPPLDVANRSAFANCSAEERRRIRPSSSAPAASRADGSAVSPVAPGLQAQDRLRVELRHARLGDPEHLPDLTERELLVVVERDDELLPLGEVARSPRRAPRAPRSARARSPGRAPSRPRSCR